ncbi:MAG: DNA polymerase III subunit [Candidatus Omnitrophica bacterium]|nr:DNA polymerase III subunit [Candidatus Omnitrophota bacterium]
MSVEIIGHKNVIDYFKLIQKNKRIGHAYLFTGKDGIGKKKTAWYIVSLLNCPQEDRPCLTCQTCRNIQAKIHPDVIEVKPKNSIGIQDIREIQQKVCLKNFSATYKVIIIDEADKLTPDASNAFLKTLEEPPANVVFFLISSKPENLLATIRSRTQKIWFCLKIDESKKYVLSKYASAENIDFLLKFSEGRLNSINKLTSKSYLLKRQKIFADSTLQFNVYETDRKSLKETTQLLLSFLRDCLLTKVGEENEVMNSDFDQKIENYQKRFSLDELADKVERLFAINETLDNINLNLANNLIRDILA